VAFETTLIDGARVIIAELLVLAQFLLCEELMLVRKDFFVPCAQITHHLLMHTPHMAMQVRPS
jgi:hypothetical protein